MTNLRLFCSCFFCSKTAFKAVKVAFVVAPLLILINNFELVFGGVLAEASSFAVLAKISMTLLVPFCVSGFSSATALMAAKKLSQFEEKNLSEVAPDKLSCLTSTSAKQ